jgi:iron complex transport system substrate-binding protein
LIRPIYIGAVVASLFAAEGCNSGPEPVAVPPEQVVSDSATDRVISLIPSATEFVYALGASELLVGRSAHCDFPSEVVGLPSVGSGFDPDLEAILTLEPTLVLASGAQRELPVLTKLQEAGVEVLILPDETIPEVLFAGLQLGSRLGEGESAEALVDRIASELDAVSVQAPEDGPKTLLFVGHDPYFVAGEDTFVGALLALSGAENLAPPGWSQVDREFILVAAPEVIIDVAASDTGEWQSMTDVPAVSSRSICRVGPNLVSRPGPRIGQAAQALSACLVESR